MAAEGGRRRYQWDFDPYMEIYVVDHDGTQIEQLMASPGYDAEGSYSSDGRQIVFTSTRDGDPDLYVMDADGSNVRQVTDVPGYDGGPFFSPDNRWIIFRSDRDKEHMLQIYAVTLDGKQINFSGVFRCDEFKGIVGKGWIEVPIRYSGRVLL